MSNPFGFDRIKQNIQRVKKDVPKILASVTRRYFLSSWEKQGYDGKAWAEVQRRVPGTKANKYAKPAARTRQILVGSGRAYLKKEVNDSLKTCNWDEIVFVVKAPYAKVHNEGLKAGRGSGFTMPQRQFMPIQGKGQPADLTEIQLKVIKRETDKAWKINS